MPLLFKSFPLGGGGGGEKAHAIFAKERREGRIPFPLLILYCTVVCSSATMALRGDILGGLTSWEAV